MCQFSCFLCLLLWRKYQDFYFESPLVFIKVENSLSFSVKLSLFVRKHVSLVKNGKNMSTRFKMMDW